MSDDPRDEEGRDEARPDDAPTGDEAPPPATWAGRKRAGEGEPEEEAGSREEGTQGMTELDGLEAELSAEFDEVGTDEQDDAGSDPDPADEQEEPPDEFQFADEDEDEADEDPDERAEDADLAGHEAPEPSPAQGPEPPGEATVEADTLSAADREAQREAAHAGLRARVGGTSAPVAARSAGAAAATAAPAAPAASGAATGDAGEPPPRSVWWRFMAASFVIVASMAAATAVSFLLFLSDIAEGLNDDNALDAARVELANVEGGDPQTILILGSDKRSGTPGDPGRSDTALLLRVDPDKQFLSLLSLPRDLDVQIPGYGTDKLNAAYSYGEKAGRGGGPKLMIQTVKELLGIPINHVVNVDFTGFYEAVNAIDCVYVDVDRHYYHTNEGLAPQDYYMEIDIPAGYSRLCGHRGLQYVRYRHTDTDIVRGARQQEFIREARQRIPPRQLLPVFGAGDELIDIFTDNTTSDISDVATIIDMLKSFVEARNAPVRQVSVGTVTDDGGVTASKQEIRAALNQFLGTDLEEATEPDAEPPRKQRRQQRRQQREQSGSGEPAMVDVTETAQQYAGEFDRFMERKKARLPIVYPTEAVASSAAGISQESRSGALAGPGEQTVYHQYKFVIPYQEPGFVSYYGVSGVNWVDPPILNNPSEVREVDGREFMLFYERDRLRLVGWKTKRGSYWVNNTLTRALSEAEMIALATATRKFDG